jgi:hypothetical protein
MKNETLMKILSCSYRFRDSKEDLERVKAIHEGTYQGRESKDLNFDNYAAVLNTVSEFATQALNVPQLASFNDILADAQEEYMPGYPPMSPVTTSFFIAWMNLDVPLPLGGPTLGDLFGQWLRSKNTLSYLWKALDILNGSFGSFYEVVGVEGNQVVRLRDILQQKEVRCWNSSGYSGRKGEVWYVRVLQPSVDRAERSVTLNTPYVFENEDRKSIETFFHRRSSEHPSFDVEDYLKHGTFPNYWLEYVFQAYAHHTGNVIYLEGLPDDAVSRPHSKGGKDL